MERGRQGGPAQTASGVRRSKTGAETAAKTPPLPAELTELACHSTAVRPGASPWYGRRAIHFAGLAERILILAGIFLRHLVDVLVGAVLGDLNHAPCICRWR